MYGLRLGVGQGHSTINFMLPALVEFHGIPEGVLASGKFFSGNEGWQPETFLFSGSELCQSSRKSQRLIKARYGKNGLWRGNQ